MSDSTGTSGNDDKGTGGAGDAPPAKKGMPMWVILLILGGLCVLGVPCVAIIAAIAIPNLLASKAAAQETAAVQNLKVLATAQAQYMNRHDYYAASAVRLSEPDSWISPDLAHAFEAYQSNEDQMVATPKAGYEFRMLLGEGGNPKSYVTATSPAGEMMLSSWAATNRPAIPGTTGNNQFYITEAGTVYKQADPSDGTYILDSAPPQGQNPGWNTAR